MNSDPQACSGKFNPIKQWLYYDAMEVYCEGEGESERDAPLVEDAVADDDSRYSGQVLVLGRALQERLASMKIFMV